MFSNISSAVNLKGFETPGVDFSFSLFNKQENTLRAYSSTTSRDLLIPLLIPCNSVCLPELVSGSPSVKYAENYDETKTPVRQTLSLLWHSGNPLLSHHNSRHHTWLNR